MLGPLGHIAALLAYVPRRQARAAADAATHRDLAWSRSSRADDLPAGLELEWLGTAGFRLSYHQGSCDLVDEEIRHRGVDYLLAGIAGRRFTARYWERLLSRLEPRVVVPHHFDDFFRPVTAPFAYSLNVNLGALPDEIGRVSRDFDLRTLDVGERVSGAPAP